MSGAQRQSVLDCERQWHIECAQQCKLLGDLNAEQMPAETAAAAHAPAPIPTLAVAHDAGDEHAEERKDGGGHAAEDLRADSPTGAAAVAAAAPTHSFMGAAQQLINEVDALRRANQELQLETARRRQEAQSAKATAEAQQRESERLSRQVQSLQAAALAAAPHAAQLDQARATIAERDAQLVRVAADLVSARSETAAALASSAPLRRELAELQQQLDGIRTLAQPKRARDQEGDAEGEEERPRAKRRLNQQQQGQQPPGPPPPPNARGGQQA